MKKSYVLEITPKGHKELENFIWKTVRKMNKLWGLKFSMEPPYVFLIKSRRDYDKINGLKTESSFLAWASNANFVFALDPKAWVKDSRDKHDFWKIMYHEFFHIYQQRTAGSLTPKWLAEGAACYFSKQPKKPASEKDLLSIFAAKVSGNIYNVGYFWAKVLAREFGEHKLIKFLKGHRRTFTPAQFAGLWKEVFGVSFSKKWGEAEIEKWRKNV